MSMIRARRTRFVREERGSCSTSIHDINNIIINCLYIFHNIDLLFNIKIYFIVNFLLSLLLI